MAIFAVVHNCVAHFLPRDGSAAFLSEAQVTLPHFIPKIDAATHITFCAIPARAAAFSCDNQLSTQNLVASSVTPDIESLTVFFISAGTNHSYATFQAAVHGFV